MTDFDGLKKALEKPSSVEEDWTRLYRDRYGRVQFAVQAHHIKRLIKPGKKVIDIGGGTGRYSIELLKHGCKVALTDLSEAFLKKAETEIWQLGLEGGLLGITQQNAVKLDAFKNAQFDHALVLAPLFFMDAQAERLSALREAARVVKPGGFIFLTLPSSLRCVAEMFYVPNLKFRLVALGNHSKNLAQALGGLNHPDTVCRLIADSGLELKETYGADSAAGMAFEKIDEMATSEENWGKMLDVLIKLSDNPAIAGLSSHTTYILRKP